jgi:hypothetical protein
MTLSFIFSLIAINKRRRVVKTGPLLICLFFYGYAVVAFAMKKFTE